MNDKHANTSPVANPDQRVYILFPGDLLDRVWARARAQGITGGDFVRRCVAAALESDDDR